MAKESARANPDYVAYCRGKSFILSKVVDPNHGDEHMALIQTIKEKIETKYGAKMGIGSTKKFLEAKGFVDNTKLGAGQLVMNEELCLHHENILKDRAWLSFYKEYADATQYGVMIVAGTAEYFQDWAKSDACLQEVKQIPDGRLFAYIEHKEDDEGGRQGYIVSIRAQAEMGSATVSNGKGYVLFENGDYYHGDLKGGKRNGHGTDHLASGNKYVGEYEDDKKHGHGTYTRANGDKYVGQYKDGKQDGQGTFTYGSGSEWNGEKYVGENKDDKMNGQGTYTWPDGRKYVGEWEDNKQHGQGTYTYASGSKYVGEWKDGDMNGQGTKTYANGKIEKGEWKNDKLIS